MLITKDIKHLLNKQTFSGVEYSKLVNVAVWWEKEPRSFLPKKILEFYKKQEHFDNEDICRITIPAIITRELEKIGHNRDSSKIQILNKNI